MGWAAKLFGAAIIGVAMVWAWTSMRGAPAAPASEAAAVTPAEIRQRDILKASAGKPADSELMRQYAAINARHFDGALPAVIVRWEPALAEVGPLTGDGFTLQGMYGRDGKRAVILLNPVLRDDAPALQRALCHEIVHAYLVSVGEESAEHGEAFQTVLARLLAEHAFEGIVAGAEERARLRAWLDAESVSIDAERRAMDAADATIRQTGAELDRDISAFNARADRPVAEAQALEDRRRAFNELVLETNFRLERDRDQLARFNREVARYNLMMAYPDGLDESSHIAAKKPR